MPPSYLPKQPSEDRAEHVEIAVPGGEESALSSTQNTLELPFRSSSFHGAETGDLTASRPPRRFAPQPVEVTSRSSKNRDKAPEAKRVRKFAPEPVETSSRSSKDGQEQKQLEKPKVRRFAPESIGTTHLSSKDRDKRRLPLSSESFASSRTSPGQDEDVAPNDQTISQAAVPGSRKFTPILLDTAKRTRKAEYSKTITFADKTEDGFGLHAREHRRHMTGKKSPKQRASVEGPDSDLDADKNKQQEMPLLDHASRIRQEMEAFEHGTRSTSRFSERSHSYCLPELDTIQSSESEPGSQPSSVSTSPGQDSPIATTDTSYAEFKHATRKRESVDESVTGYLRQIEAKRAEERMREQVLAAFPNSGFHEPVHHYVDEEQDTDSEDLEDRPATWEGHEDEYDQLTRRESTRVPWEQLEMQRHAERLEQERLANQVTHKQTTQGPWWVPPEVAAEFQPDSEKSQQELQRPPMLGNDLHFPRCLSPEPARFDVTQGSTALRNQMCYLTNQSESAAKQDDEEPGLWQGKAPPRANFTSIKTPSASVHSSSTRSPGLWGGFCQDTGEQQSSGLAPPSGPTGLMTPRYEANANPFELSFAVPPGAAVAAHPGISTPQTPLPKLLRTNAVNTLDALLVSEKELDEVMARDYPDTFITQVYNYLSLGYPSVARAFDAELSKISRIPIADLRSDDAKAKEQPRGYIRLGNDFEGGGGEIREEGCMRWLALRLYVREWARQEKDMVRSEGEWGTVAARRGSWGN